MEINNRKPLYTSKINPNATTQNAVFYYMRAITSYNSGNNEEAEKDFNKAIETENNNSIAYFNRGTFYLNEKKYKPAIDDFLKAIRLRTKFAEAYYNLSCAYAQILSFREALANLKKAVNFDKHFANIAIYDKDFNSINKMREFKDITLVV